MFFPVVMQTILLMSNFFQLSFFYFCKIKLCMSGILYLAGAHSHNNLDIYE